MNEVNVYINFALYTVLGKTAEADGMMRLYGEEIRAVAAVLAHDFPIARVPLYRGVLLDPAVPYAHDPRLTFMSWSEDQGVAEWFACSRSTVSSYVAEQSPHLRGYLLRRDAPPPRVLFHHTWAAVFRGLAPLALVHPHMGAEGARQIAWSLRTQREVITEPVDGLEPMPAAHLDARALTALERRLTPPHVAAAEGIRC